MSGRTQEQTDGGGTLRRDHRRRHTHTHMHHRGSRPWFQVVSRQQRQASESARPRRPNFRPHWSLPPTGKTTALVPLSQLTPDRLREALSGAHASFETVFSSFPSPSMVRRPTADGCNMPLSASLISPLSSSPGAKNCWPEFAPCLFYFICAVHFAAPMLVTMGCR